MRLVFPSWQKVVLVNIRVTRLDYRPTIFSECILNFHKTTWLDPFCRNSVSHISKTTLAASELGIACPRLTHLSRIK